MEKFSKLLRLMISCPTLIALRRMSMESHSSIEQLRPGQKDRVRGRCVLLSPIEQDDPVLCRVLFLVTEPCQVTARTTR